MHAITLETIQEKQAELAALIQQFSTANTTGPTALHVPSVEINLYPGEHYAGPVLNAHGGVEHHLVLMAQRPNTKLNWKAAMAWAQSVGGDLPSPQEQALLYANCKPHLDPSWHWSNKVHEDGASSAWICDFGNGVQLTILQSFEGSAVAVRRV